MIAPWLFLLGAGSYLLWQLISPESLWRFKQRLLRKPGQTEVDRPGDTTLVRWRVSGMVGLTILGCLGVYFAAGHFDR